VQIHFLVGQAGKPVKAKGRAGCPPHNKLSLQKWDAPDAIALSNSTSKVVHLLRHQIKLCNSSTKLTTNNQQLITTNFLPKRKVPSKKDLNNHPLVAQLERGGGLRLW